MDSTLALGRWVGVGGLRVLGGLAGPGCKAASAIQPSGVAFPCGQVGGGRAAAGFVMEASWQPCPLRCVCSFKDKTVKQTEQKAAPQSADDETVLSRKTKQREQGNVAP